MVRRHLVFTADFPDDFLFSEEGEILVPAGRELADAIAKALVQRGCRCSDITQRDYYAWEFRVTYQRTTVAAVLQRIDHWILTLALGFSLRRIFSGQRRCSIGEVAEKVAQVLTDDLQCKEMTIYSNEDFPY